MSTSPLKDAFAHHVWASLRVVDACLELEPGQLDATTLGTRGSIFETVRHLVGSDAWYLFVITGGRVPAIDEERMDLPDLRAEMEAHGDAWSQILEEALDPDTVIVYRRSDGSEAHAPLGIRLAQALHHGSDHRSQVCTVLTTLGVDPPAIDLWDFAEHDGRLTEIPPPT